METPSALPGTILNWLQPSSLERRFELHSANGLIGKLHFATVDTAYGSLSDPERTTASWILQPVGIVNAYIDIKNTEANETVAVYRPNLFNNGWLEFTKGSRFHWQSLSFFGPKWSFADEQHEKVVTMQGRWYSLLKIQATVNIEPPWQGLDKLPLLLIAGWYLMVRDHYAGI
jgi:hypothetical protein